MFGRMRVRIRVVAVASVLLVGLLPEARAAEPIDYEKEATAAFALGHYAEAAEAFEKAFRQEPEAALLYNAAQAHRLAGNKERALTLYENYMRVYGNKEKRAEVQSRIDELKAAIDHDSQVRTRPPNEPEPVAPAAPVSPIPARRPPPVVASVPPEPLPEPERAPPMLTAPPGPSPSEADHPSTSRVWLWTLLGVVVVGGAVAGLLVLKNNGQKYPNADLHVDAN
jgi:tetratricopeptide (TPR) repeat protein